MNSSYRTGCLLAEYILVCSLFNSGACMHIFVSTTNFPPKNVECIAGAMRQFTRREHYKATTTLIKGRQTDALVAVTLIFLFSSHF